MLERLTGKLLSRFLSKYFILPGESDPEYDSSSGIGSSPSKTQLAVWSGYLSLQHLRLRPSLINDHFQKKGLPFEFSYGFIDRVEVTIPWTQLRGLLSSGSGSGGAKNKGESADAAETEIVVVLDGLYILLNTRYEFEDEKLRESQKVQRRKELDAAMAFVADGGSSASPSSDSYLKSFVKNRVLSETFLNDLFDKMTNRIQIHVRNVHVRLEDLESDPSRPCCFGMTLESVHLTSESEEDVSTQLGKDEPIRQTKIENPLEKILARKVMQVYQFSIYCNGMNGNETKDTTMPGAAAPHYHDPPEYLPLQSMSDQPFLLSRAMHATIPRRRPRSFDSRNANIGPKHTFLLFPSDATSITILSKPNNVESGGYTKAKLRAETNVTKFQIGVDESTLAHIACFQARLTQHKSLIRHRLHRPTVPIEGNCKIWWKYIARVVQKELREAGNVKRGVRWSWLRWHNRVELRKTYLNLYERWLDYGVEGDDAVVVDSNGSDHDLPDSALSKDTLADNKLTVKEFEHMRAIEDATIDDELTVSDILFFRAMLHSKRQKQTPKGPNSSNKHAIDSEYSLTRFLRRVVKSDDMDEEYARLLAYLERKEEEDATKLQQQEQHLKTITNSGPNKMSELSVVFSITTLINHGSLKLFSRRCHTKQLPIFDVSLSAVQSKFSLLENFDTFIVEASVLDFVGADHRRDGLRNVVISRCTEGKASTVSRITDNLLLPVDLNGKDAIFNVHPSPKHDSPLFHLNLIWHPPAGAEPEKYDASLSATIEKIRISLRTGFDWPQRCKGALSISPSQQKMESLTISSAFWEDLSMNWESTKASLVAKADWALQKQRKLDINVTIGLPTLSICDENETTLSIDLGHAHIGTKELAGVIKEGSEQIYPSGDTPKKSFHRHSQHSLNSSKLLNDRNKDYLFTHNSKENGQTSFLSPALPSISDGEIFESPYDSASFNGSFSGISESGRRRTRGKSIGNSKLFSVAENEEYSTVVDAEANVNGELMKCFYDYFAVKMGGMTASISTPDTTSTFFEGPGIEAQIAKSIIPADHSLCKLRISCVIDHMEFSISPDSMHSIKSLLEHMKHDIPKNSASHQKCGLSPIFPSITIQEPVTTDDESSVDENEFLDAIDAIDDFQPYTASQWFNQQWMFDEESVGDATLETFARTPSRRYRFPSISEVSSGEEKGGGYLSAENLSKLEEGEEPRRRSRSLSQISGDDDDSFHSAISLDNREELIKAVQDDIRRCEADIDVAKEKIKGAVDMYKDNWRKECRRDSKHHMHQKRKLKSQLLRLEAELLALNASYREIVIKFPERSEPEQQEEGDDISTAQRRALHRASSLIIARKMRASSLNILSPTKASGHYSLSRLNRDLLFISFTLSSITLNVWKDADKSDSLSCRRSTEQGLLSFLCNQLSLSIHHRQIDTRLRVCLDRATAVSPISGTVFQCGYLDDSAVVRQSPIQIDEASFLRVVAYFQRHSKSKSRQSSKLKLKTNFGPIEILPHSFVDVIPFITLMRVNPQPKQTTQKPQKEPTIEMSKLASAVMESSDVSTFEENQSIDIDVEFTSLSICLENKGTLFLATITGIHTRLARRTSPLLLKTRGQLDLRVSNFQLHDLSRLEQAHELIGCQSSFDKLVQARMRVQLSRRENTGGWCVENGPDDFTAEELNSFQNHNEDLCWNIHLGLKCQSAVMFVLSPDLKRIVDSTKLFLTELKAAVSANSHMTPSEKQKNTNIRSRFPTDDESHQPAIPVRWRLDYSLLECIIIVPGKHYNYYSSYDSGNHLRLSNSIHLCLRPDPKSRNILIDLSSRSYIVLNTHDEGELNAVEPITVSVTALTVPSMLKLEPPNIHMGALDTPCAWSTNDATMSLELSDRLDLSVCVETSHLILNISPPLFVFAREVEGLLKSKQENKSSIHSPHETSTKEDQAFSVQATVPSVSATILYAPDADTAHPDTSLCIDMLRVSIASDAHHIVTKVSTCDTVLFYTEGDSKVPVFHTTRLVADGLDDVAPEANVLFSATVSKCVDNVSKSLKLSFKSGISYFVVAVPFIKQSTRFFESIRGKGTDIRTQNQSESSNKKLSITEKLTRLGLQSITYGSSCGVNLVLPSQDVRFFCEDKESALNAICLNWTFKLRGIATFKCPGARDTNMLYQMASSDLKELDEQKLMQSNRHVTIDALNHLVSSEKNSYTKSSLIVFKTDWKAQCYMARSELILSERSSGLAAIFQTVNEQLIIPSFSYNIVTSVVTSSSTPSTDEAEHMEDSCSLGFYVDVGAVDILWNVAKSRFGLSDAFTLSICPLLQKDKKNQPKRKQAPLQQHNIESVSNQATSPIQHTSSTSNPESTIGQTIKIPENVYLFLSNSIIISSVRIASIQVTCIPSNAKEVLTSPIMKAKLASLRFGTSLLRCPSYGGIAIPSKRTRDLSTSHLYLTCWADFSLSAHYHNRRLVIWEPLLETWAANMQGCLNLTEASGMEPFTSEVGETHTPKANDTNRFVRLIEGIKDLRRNKTEASDNQESTETFPFPATHCLDLCHFIQTLLIPKCLELAKHPKAARSLSHFTPVHLNEISHLVHGFLSENDSISAMMSISKGKADHFVQHAPAPLNINMTGALIDCIVGFSDLTLDNQHISPHYIRNETGLTMRWKDDSNDPFQGSSGRLDPGESEELRLRGFPLRSFISLELYRNPASPCFKAMQVNVDSVGVKRYTLKYQEKQVSELYVVVRVQLIGSAKVVSIESPVLIINSSSTPFQLRIKEKDKEIWGTTVLPRSSGYRRNLDQIATPIPIDFIANAHEKRISWHLSLTGKHYFAQEQPSSVKVPISIYEKSRRRGLLGDVDMHLPMASMPQNVAISACFIRVGNCSKADADGMHPEQRLLVLRPLNEFRNNLPYPVVFELRVSNSKGEETEKWSHADPWLNIGQANSGDSLQFHMARRDAAIELRIKVIDEGNYSFPHWSTSVCLTPEGNLTAEYCILTNKNGESLQVSIGLEINHGTKDDTLIEQILHHKDAARVVFIYVPSILVDYTGQSLEFKSGSTILRHHDSDARQASVLGGRIGLSNIQDSSCLNSRGFAHMMGGKAASLAIRQSGHRDKSPWSQHILLASRKTRKRIFVPRSSPISRPLVLCAKISDAPKEFGSRYTRVVALYNQYTLVNQLPIEIEVISTNKQGRWLKRKPLVVSCNHPVPFHFDDNGFFRLRPKEIGWTYSGLVSITQRRSDIALRLRNKLAGTALIITVEFNTDNGPAVSVVIRRSRAVPFRIENYSLLPLQFAQQTGNSSDLTRKWSESTILLSYHQAEYAWDEPDSAKRCIDVAFVDLDFGQPPDKAASLGRFYLDLLAPGTNVPVTNSHFDAYVIADGPTRVLKIVDVSMSMAAENNTLSGTLSRRFNYKCSICIDVGVSLVDWKPQELVYLYLGDLCLHRRISSGEDSMAFTLRQFSVDCSLWTTKYPVLLDIKKEGKRKDAVSVSWCKDMNTRGKDITLLRYVDIELGKLVLKVDGPIITFLIQMFKTASKSLDPQLVNDKNAVKVRDTNIKQQANTDVIQHDPVFQQYPGHITAVSAAKTQVTQLNRTLQCMDVFLPSGKLQTNTPKHKYYIEQITVSTLRAEISYCGASPLPAWLSPAFMFEALPIRFPSYAKGHVYGSTNEHIQNIKGHYNVWRFLFGLSLKPMFVVRACIFTTRQSLLTIFSSISRKPSQMLSYFYSRVTDQEENSEETSVLYSTYSTQNKSGLLTGAAYVLLHGAKRVFSSLQLLFGISSQLESDVRVRVPRLFARQDNSDVLVDYVQGDNTGRVMLSRIRMSRHLFEGYLVHGNIDGFGDNVISSSVGCLVFILTLQRLLILKGSKNMNISSVFWEVELENITLVEVYESPQDQSVSLQIFFMNRTKLGLDMLASKCLLFKDTATGRHLYKCILSVTRNRF